MIQFNKSFVCTQLNKWLNHSIWPRDGTLTGTNNSGQSEPEKNDNERVLQIAQSFMTWASSSDAF